jgi:hypothetical protein
MTAFVPTHRVPPTGIDSWPRPDPQAAVGPRIDGGLDVQVVDGLGDWAKVMFSNGWTTWVDGRLLVGAHTATPTRRAAAGALGGVDLRALLADRTKALSCAGALLLALASVLSWLRGTGISQNSFDVPVKFLFDYEISSNSGPKVGWLLLALAVAVVIAVVKAAWPRLVRGLGGVAVAVAVLYVIQLQRLVSKAPGASLTDAVGFGVVAAAVGGALIAFADRLGTKRG